MVFVLSSNGSRLMPTTEYRARKLLSAGKAEIHQYRPFTIKLIYRETGSTQPVEYKCDTGYMHIGISVCTEKCELVNEQRDMLPDEPEKHRDKKIYRSTRRNRKTRYRKPRSDNRKGLICSDGFAPSIRNKRDTHVSLFYMYHNVIPLTYAEFEMGQFDTQLLKAVEAGQPLPQGEDYQHGERYGYDTLREAVFTRDNYTCLRCGKSAIKDDIILRTHHIGYWKQDRSNRMTNIATVCTKCHIPKNHKPGHILYGWQPELKAFKGATFMTTVRKDMVKKIRNIAPDIELSFTYGALTKHKRKILNVKKTHSNDAYCMGKFHPKHRTDFKHYKKIRRNNRVLCKFYDAKYTDLRDGSVKKGQELSTGRTSRKESRHTELNERIYRGHKVSKGRLSIRKRHYIYRPHDKVLIDNRWYSVCGVISSGTRLSLNKAGTVYIKKIQKVIHTNGWYRTL